MIKKKVVFFGVVLLVGFLAANVFADQIDAKYIEVGTVTGVTSSFNAGTKTLSFNYGQGGFLYSDTGEEFPFAASEMIANFTGVVDHSAGGIAYASSNSGTWSLKLFQPAGNEVLNISGTLEWFTEEETIPDHLFGRGHIVPTAVNLIDKRILGGADLVWQTDEDGHSALNTNTISITPAPLTNFKSDFSSPNVEVMIWASGDNMMPEPITLVLLTLGGLFIRKR
jgi:hypothetical protein